MKRLFLVVALLPVGLFLVMILRAELQPSLQLEHPALPRVDLDSGVVVDRFAGALRMPTVSVVDEEDSETARTGRAAFDTLSRYLERAFPLTHARLRWEPIHRHSRLGYWRGTDSSLAPVLLMGHLDVVPVDTTTGWSVDPFGGEISDGFVWGRGALDNKMVVTGLLEAAELLLGVGFEPERPVYFFFGHDEELGGTQGAAVAVEHLERRGVRLHFVLDEGGVVVDSLVPGLEPPAALIGIAEKGGVTFELSVTGTGGHASAPPPENAIGILARAVDRIDGFEFPARLGETPRWLFRFVGPELPLGMRIVFANLWLTAPLVRYVLGLTPPGNATIRTTLAPTVIEGGVRANVLPGDARAVVNVRTLPGDTIEEVGETLRAVVEDERVRIQVIGDAREASPVSPVDHPGFRAIQQTIHQAYPEAVVAPYLLIAGTDARYFHALTDAVYRFQPVRLTPGLLASIHGTDERVAAEEYLRAVRFYVQLIREATAHTQVGDS